MRKLVYTICIVFMFAVTANSQESVPFSLRLFMQQYGNFIDNFTNQEEVNLNSIFDDSSPFFLNLQDTLLWPDNFDLSDNFYKHRLGPKEFFQSMNDFKEKSSMDYFYGYKEFADVELIKSKSTKYFDKFRLYTIEKHYFQDYNGSDSIISVTNFYDLISWFNPGSGEYEWRINKIQERQSKSGLTPDYWSAGVQYHYPIIKVNDIDNLSSTGISSGVKANWIIGGKKFINYSFSTGVQYSFYNLNAKTDTLVFETDDMIDKDNYPFTLMSNLTGLDQSLSFQMLTVPVHFHLNKYFLDKRQSVSFYGGINANMPFNESLKNSSSQIEYKGKYLFNEYPNEPIILSDLENYNYGTYEFTDKDNTKLSNVFLSLELGAELNWYIGKKWAANASLGYIKSITPVFTRENQRLTYNEIEKSGSNPFEPSLNSFLTLNEKSYLNSVKVGFGINYFIDKPVIPHGKVGLRNSEMTRLIKNKMVLASSSFSQQGKQKNLTIYVSDISSGLMANRVRYRYVGPTPKFFQQGKLNEGTRKGNKLSLNVPESNIGTKLFLEEPYGFNLLPQGIEYSNGGLYGEIKIINSENIWEGQNDRRNLNLRFEKLKPLNILILTYKYSFDDGGNIRNDIISNVRQIVSDAIKKEELCVIYVSSDEPQGWLVSPDDNLEVKMQEIEIKLINSDDIVKNLEGLKIFINSNSVNPRRSIDYNLFASMEFISIGQELVEEFAPKINIDDNFIEYSVYVHDYKRYSEGIPPALEKKVKIIKRIN